MAQTLLICSKYAAAIVLRAACRISSDGLQQWAGRTKDEQHRTPPTDLAAHELGSFRHLLASTLGANQAVMTEANLVGGQQKGVALWTSTLAGRAVKTADIETGERKKKGQSVMIKSRKGSLACRLWTSSPPHSPAILENMCQSGKTRMTCRTAFHGEPPVRQGNRLCKGLAQARFMLQYFPVWFAAKLPHSLEFRFAVHCITTTHHKS